MTREEYGKLRRILRGHVTSAWIAYQESSAGEFVASEKTLALYDRYWKRLQRAARLLKCTPAQAVSLLGIREA